MLATEGWHHIHGQTVYVNDRGFVTRGISCDGQRTVWPYHWSKRFNCWIADSCLTLDAFRAALARGTAALK